MSKQLEVRILPDDDAADCTCPLCGKSLALSCFAGMLYDGGKPLGCICEGCLEESPKQAGGRLRERVVDLYSFIQKAQESLSGEAWSRCIEKVHSRAEQQFRSSQGPATVYPQAGNPAGVFAQLC